MHGLLEHDERMRLGLIHMWISPQTPLGLLLTCRHFSGRDSGTLGVRGEADTGA